MEIIVDKKHLEEIIKKYPSISKKELEKWIFDKCEYYSKMNNNTLEVFGFENGTKWEFYDKIKDSVLLINADYKKLDVESINEKIEESKQKLTLSQIKKELKKIYQKIVEILKYYMDLEEKYCSLIAIWIIGTYFHDEFSTYPYLYFNAMKGSGKTRVLSLISKLSKKGEILTSLTEAVLFRTTGTLCIDELEKTEGLEKMALRELLNSAYKKGIKVKRMRKKKTIDGETHEVEEFNVYRPICMANIWGLENVLSDRCIPIILEKSDKFKIIKIIEDFDENEEIQDIISSFKGITYTTYTYTMLFNIQKCKWNAFIKQEGSVSSVSSVSSINRVSSVKSIDNINKELFIKINNSKLSGRDLELFFPLYLISNYCGKLDEILEISQQIVKERKEKDTEENRDVQLIEFISQYKDIDFVSVAHLTNEFRDILGIPEKQSKWLNTTWIGRALRRLVLVKDKRSTGRNRQVMLNIEKAKEKIKMFKEPELEEKPEELKKDDDFLIKYEKIK